MGFSAAGLEVRLSLQLLAAPVLRERAVSAALLEGRESGGHPSRPTQGLAGATLKAIPFPEFLLRAPNPRPANGVTAAAENGVRAGRGCRVGCWAGRRVPPDARAHWSEGQVSEMSL